jgi:DNA-binding MurR/RpiR family transcriptional regulator
VQRACAKRLAITDGVLSPVARGAELVLAVNDAGLLGFRSLTSAMCLAQTLAMGLAFRDRRGGQTGALDDIDC